MLWVIVALYGGVWIACVNVPPITAQTPSVDELRQTIASIPKADPFHPREFQPNVDGKWIGNAVSYGPFRAGQAPGIRGPSEAEILEDLNIITQHWNLIRIYGADDDSERILEVIRKNDLPLKVMLGIWLTTENDNPLYQQQNLAQVARGIALANQFKDIVIAVNAGNETQVFWSGHRLAQKTLIQYIRAVRWYVSQPVTTADDYNFWNKPESQTVADEIDFIVMHAYALWNGQRLANAISWTDSVYHDIQARHPNKVIVLGETGWATDYNASKIGEGQQGTLIKGEVSLARQEQFLRDLTQWIEGNQITTFWFEVFDEPWKGGGDSSPANEVEKHWGLFYVDRTPKPSVVHFLK
ncbi:MAG: glycosyl hydrolase family 17 [Gemmatimonadetes bacterium]|nr:MAG: glycosyl hydrolase family 17 [Gemmatimonadota bacterium]